MVSLTHFPSPRAGAVLLGLAAAALGGCEATTGAYTEPYGQPVYTSNQYPNGYPDQYPAQYPTQSTYPAQPVYPNGQPVYGQPAYPSNTAVYAPGAVDAPDDYIYYPDAEVYYSPSLNEYSYRTGNSWVWRREPPPGWRRNEASVHIRINGGPERHHDEIRRMYPHDNGRDRDRDDRRRWDRR
jgi:hypothetical protein